MVFAHLKSYRLGYPGRPGLVGLWRGDCFSLYVVGTKFGTDAGWLAPGPIPD